MINRKEINLPSKIYRENKIAKSILMKHRDGSTRRKLFIARKSLKALKNDVLII